MKLKRKLSFMALAIAIIIGMTGCITFTRTTYDPGYTGNGSSALVPTEASFSNTESN